jgi:multiple sugar transport system permease protein
MVFLIPTLLFLGLTSLYPLGYSLVKSLGTWDLRFSPDWSYSGLSNYTQAVQDSSFVHSLAISMLFALITVSVEAIAGMAIALLVTRESSSATLMRPIRSLLLIPMVMAPIVVGVLWRMMFNTDYGLVNYWLSLVHVPPINWLAEPSASYVAILITDIWEWTPFIVLAFIAAIMALPKDLQEAASVDGAGVWQVFWRVNLPLLRPVIVIVVLLRFLDAFKVVDTVYVMTQGGPGDATQLISYWIYQEGLSYFDIGYASAASWILLILVFLLSFFLIRSRLQQLVRR